MLIIGYGRAASSNVLYYDDFTSDTSAVYDTFGSGTTRTWDSVNEEMDVTGFVSNYSIYLPNQTVISGASYQITASVTNRDPVGGTGRTVNMQAGIARGSWTYGAGDTTVGDGDTGTITLTIASTSSTALANRLYMNSADPAGSTFSVHWWKVEKL